MKCTTIRISLSLVFGSGLLLVLLWLLGGGEIDIPMFAVRAAEPDGFSAPSDVYCVTLAGGGPYPGCDQVFTSVQDAVDAASGGEVIKVAAGDYTGVQARPAPAGYDGPSVITQVVYIDKGVTIQGGYTTTDWITSYPITQPTTLDAQGQGRVFLIAGEISPTVEGVRVTGGDAAGLGGEGAGCGGGVYVVSATVTVSGNYIFSNTTTEDGGGLYLSSSSATLIGNAVFSNTARYGGGLASFGSDVTLSDNVVSDNAAESAGGLFLDHSDATLIGNRIISNTANGAAGGLTVLFSDATLSENTISSNVAGDAGGGLYFIGNHNTTTLSGNIAVSNTARIGGGLSLTGGDITVTLSSNTIMSNTAREGGGGLFLQLWPGYDGNVTLVRNTISFNAANGTDFGGGGGLNLASGATLIGNTIFSNTAASGGGGISLGGDAVLDNNVIADNALTGGCGSGIFVGGATVQLRHNTIARNRGSGGSGLCLDSSTVTLTNTILVSHTVGITITDDDSLARLEGTLWGSGVWANETDWGGAGTIITGTVNIWGDPDFVDPDNGDYHIGPGSAALDEGVGAGVSMDIDNEPRCYGAPDLGADEYWPPEAIYLPLVLRRFP